MEDTPGRRHHYSGKTGVRALLTEYWRTPGFRFAFYLRKVAYYSGRERSFGLLPYLDNRLWLNHYRFRSGFEISPTTRIGPGLYLGTLAVW